MSKFIFSLFLFSMPLLLFAQADSLKKVLPKPEATKHQLRISFDASKFLFNALSENRTSYELAFDYYHRKEIYFVSEAGFGNSSIDYADLKYNSSNTFVRLGVDKAMFVRKKPNDWGMAFVGARYVVGLVQRGEARYTTNDGFGGRTSGIIASKNFSAHWLELVGGMKVELFPKFFAGWTVRYKFLLNQKSFGALKPASIAGYGGGEKNTAFDFNFYFAYAIRWNRVK